MQLRSVLLIIVALAGSTQAQEPKPRETSNEQQTVTNDDQGCAFIIEREPTPLSGLSNAGRSVISGPQQYSIFLGKDWAKPALRARQAELANLLANLGDQATVTALNESGVKNLFGPTLSREKLEDLEGNISDLDIQSVLGHMVQDGSLLPPNPNTIYTVFLDPQLRSTLGAMLAGKHYAAYHNFFNVSGMKLHYVVVPFEADRKAANQIAFRALVAAALNPTGSTSH